MKALRIFLLLLAPLILTALSHGDDALIDSCQYSDDSAAQAVWISSTRYPPAIVREMDGSKVIALRCDFTPKDIERCYWDRRFETLDLSQSEGISFDILCTNSKPVSSYSVYFQTPTGWHGTSFAPKRDGVWETIQIRKSDTRPEGQPGGWDKILALRVGAWKGDSANTEIFVRNIRRVGVLGADTHILIVRSDKHPEESSSFVKIVSNLLGKSGIRHVTYAESEITADLLGKARTVLLPNNSDMDQQLVNLLKDYLSRGGNLIACYQLPEDLRKAAGLPSGTYRKAEKGDEFASIHPDKALLPGAPAAAEQDSWNIVAIPKSELGDGVRSLGEWYDSEGHATGISAILAAGKVIYVGHVLTQNDPENKAQLLMSLVGLQDPEVWTKAIATRREAFEAALTQAQSVQNKAKSSPTLSESVREAIAAKQREAEALEKRFQSANQAKDYTDAFAALEEATLKYREIYFLCQESKPNEFRGFWCHSAFGVKGMTWDQAISRLKENGFTAIFPNMLWGGVAYYPSDVLPVAPEIAEQGDQVAECLAACRKHGIQIHVWKVNWNLGHAVSPAHVEKMRSEKRLQASYTGEEQPWLCPSNPLNQQLEIDSLAELVRKYPVDGIHFDYIRYPSSDYCFCKPCRDRFEKATGKPVADWPKDVRPGGSRREEWIPFCQNNITTVVKAVSEQVRQIRPGTQVSAAVFRSWDTDSRSVMQDWKLWCEKGYLDFVCPMDYTASPNTFDRWVEKQKEWAGPARLMPGIGASSSQVTLDAEAVIEQIEITRKHNTDGFLIFNYTPHTADTILPMLGLGETKP